MHVLDVYFPRSLYLAASAQLISPEFDTRYQQRELTVGENLLGEDLALAVELVDDGDAGCELDLEDLLSGEALKGHDHSTLAF